MIWRIWFFLLCVAAPLFSEEEILVRLSSQSELLPLLLGQIEQSKVDFSPEYLKELEAIIRFDFSYNGMTKIIKSKDPSLANSFDVSVDFAELKKQGILYLIRLKIEGRSLKAKLVATNGNFIKLIEGLALTGNLAKDRVQIHQLSDKIFEIFFHKKGIASSKIIFTSRNKLKDTKNGQKWVSEIYESDYDGGNTHQITHEDSSIVTPAYQKGSDGNFAFCFVSYKIGQPKIFFVSKRDGKVRRLTTLRGNQMTPAISPDKTVVAFACDVTGSTDLFVQPFHPDTGALGLPRQIFTSRAAAQASPSFSPDSKKVVFVSGKDGSPKIYSMAIPAVGVPLKNVKPTLISKRCRENSSPQWSPDGKKVAFSGKSSGPRQIWIYDFETGQESQLTEGPGDKENPAWAEDSLHIVFNRADANGSELFLVNLNQPQAVKISSGTGEKRFPCWK